MLNLGFFLRFFENRAPVEPVGLLYLPQYTFDSTPMVTLYQRNLAFCEKY